MKKTVASLLLCSIATSIGAQSDLNLMGLSGKINGTSIYLGDDFRYKNTYDGKGNFVDFNLERIYYTYPATVTKRTNGGFQGLVNIENQSCTFKVTKSKGRITKVVFDDGKGTLTRSYTYSNGNLTQVNENYVYYTEDEIEYGANYTGLENYANELEAATDDYYNDLEKIADNPLNLLNPAKTSNKIAKSANKASNRIAKAAAGVGVNSYVRTKKTKHEDKHIILYKDYVFDDFGNWVSRLTSRDGGSYKPEIQSIQYDKDFWSEFYWKKLEPMGDLYRIEAFATNLMCSDKYKQLAVDYWNSRILKEVAQKHGNNLDSLCHVSLSPIISKDNKEKAMNYVREQVWEREVLPIRDFSLVPKMKETKRMDMLVFDQFYNVRIDSLTNALRADSLINLTQKAQKEFDNGQMQETVLTANTIMGIDGKNQFAAGIKQKAEYKILETKEADNTIEENDYTAFLDNYPNTDCKEKLEDSRILLASSSFNQNTTEDEFNRVLAMPATESAHKEVEKRAKKWRFKINRGRFFHVGIEGNFAVGASNSITGGGLLLRLGYTANYLNFVTGVKVNYLTSTSKMFKQPKEAGDGYFDRLYLSIPAMFQLNVKRGYKGCTYVGLGADINVSTFSARLRDIENIKDSKFGNKTSITPRLSFGGRSSFIEAEVFATYDVANPFDTDFINGYKLVDGSSISTHCNPDVYEKQIVKDGFFDRLRGGIALRIWF